MSSRNPGERPQRGQSLAEFALFLPILIMLLLGIADMARVYSSMIAVESAAREAADWGAFRPGNWDVPTMSYTTSVAEMERRACTPLVGLTDYVGATDGTTCTNPVFLCELYEPNTATWAACDQPGTCAEPDKLGSSAIPCKVRVTLTFTFDVLVPTELIGLGTSFTFIQSSVFNVADTPAT